MTVPRKFLITEFYPQCLNSYLVTSDCAESPVDSEKPLWDERLSIMAS